MQGERVKISQGVLFAETVRMVVSAHPLLACPMRSPSPQRKAPVENNDEDSAVLDRQTYKIFLRLLSSLPVFRMVLLD